MLPILNVSFPGGLDGKESASHAGNLGLIPGLGRSPGGGHGNPLQYSLLENPMDRGAWWATVRGVAPSWTAVSKQQQHTQCIVISSVASGKWLSIFKIYIYFAS